MLGICLYILYCSFVAILCNQVPEPLSVSLIVKTTRRSGVDSGMRLPPPSFPIPQEIP